MRGLHKNECLPTNKDSFGYIVNLKGELLLMSGGFVKIKKLVKINNVIKSILNSAATASLLGAVFMLLKKRGIYTPSLIIFASVLGAGAVLTFVLLNKESQRQNTLTALLRLHAQRRRRCCWPLAAEAFSIRQRRQAAF